MFDEHTVATVYVREESISRWKCIVTEVRVMKRFSDEKPWSFGDFLT